ncbi:GGDEF domain-containing protein [Luteimonas sp. Y-2-2-4F]|nr:GGDEF domain-containing protein [Luteimonas sp. Y-2-2-4F]MCD9031509.1 GGDEF domain-containing protein [Luteimonas sp. Y-2-2-4F]
MTGQPARYRRLRIPAVLLALALLTGTGIAAVTGVRSLSQTNRWLEHSYRVINLLDSAEGAVLAAESSARAYRLTARSPYRPQYFDAIARAERLGGDLIAVTADNPEQQARARRFNEAILEHTRALQILLDAPALAALSESERQSRIDASLQRVARFRAISREMLAAESDLLKQRQARSQREAGNLIVFIVLALTGSLAVLGLLLASLAIENRRSRRLEREARTAVRDLQQSLAQRDALAEQRRAQSVYAGMLQSCQTRDEIMTLTARTIEDLVPGASGRCYLSRTSQNFLESAGSFGERIVSSGDVLMNDQCWALRRGQPHYTRGRQGGLRCAHIDPDVPVDGLSSLCVPLAAQNNSLGLLHVTAPTSDRPDDDNDAAIIISIAEQMGMALANLQLRETLRVQSLRDPLTGLFNRRYLEESLQREMLRCERRRLPLSLLMLDVDHFKQFNDRHGHAAGDAVLAQVGRVLQSQVRSEDLACRYGGEEFTVIMPEVDGETAVRRGNEIRTAISATTILHMGKTLGPVTASVGIATAPADSADPGSLQEIADATLYRAKAEGRDRVLHASLPTA